MQVELTPCASPSIQKIDLCKNCQRAQPVKEDQEPEYYAPRRRLMGGYTCIGYEHKDQGNLFDEK